MSISSRIEQIEQHLKDDYDVLGLAGAKGTELPIGYTQVDYIESSGTQYIDTGYTPNINTEVIMEFKDTNKSSWENYFGSENFRFLRRSLDSTAFRWVCARNADMTNLSIDNKRKLKFNKNGIYDENETLIFSNPQTSLTSTKNMLLFLSWLGSSFDNFGIFIMYSFKIYDNGTLVRNFIPCYRNSDNEVGLYDLVNDVFYTNQGTGAFTYGSVVLNRNIQNLKPQWLDRLVYFMNNGLDVVWNNWLPKVTGSGETITLNNTIEAKMDFVYKGNTSQKFLPNEYTELDYITSDGNSYIDTGKTLGDNFKIETKFIHNQQSSNEQPIISTWSQSFQWFNLYISSNNQLRFYASGNHTTSNPTLTLGSINTVSYSRNSNNWVGVLNGETVTFDTYIRTSNPTTFKILSRGDGTRGSYVSIYRLKLFENNILTMDLIPCYRNSDNVIGMYDIVNNIFYTNSGTGNFTYGSIAPNPECPIPVHVVTGDNEVKVEGKNLATENFNDSTTGIALSRTIESGTPIYISSNINNTVNVLYAFMDSTFKGNIPVTYSNGKITYSDTPNFTFNRVRCPSDRICTESILALGSTATEYQPYQSQTYPINLGVKNLIDLINFVPISNTTVVSLIDNGINVNNVSGGYGTKITIENLTANTNYYLSYNWKNISNGTNRVVVFAGTGTSTTLESFYNLNGGTFNTGDNTTINIWFYAAIPGIAEVEYTNIQLEEGTIKHSYTPSWFAPIELCKIGDYQDYIYKENGKWYKYSTMGKAVVDGSEDWRKSGDARNISYYYASSNDANYKFNGIKTDIMDTTSGSSVYPAYSTHFKFIANATLFSDIQGAIFDKISNIIELRFGFGLSTSISTLELFKQWLSDNNVTVYFPLATPTVTEITDTTLLNQLEAIKLSYNEQTNISQTNTDKPFILDVVALGELD